MACTYFEYLLCLLLTTSWLLSANALSSCWLESNLLIAGGTPGRGADPGDGCAGGDGCAVGGGAAFIRLMALSIRWLESYLGGGDGLDGDGLEVGSGTVLVEHSLSSSRLESSRNELYRGMGIEDHFEWKESVDRGSQVKSSQVKSRLEIPKDVGNCSFPPRVLLLRQSLNLREGPRAGAGWPQT